jgi:3-hydroxybutyryl-CoA dehydrogenase
MRYVIHQHSESASFPAGDPFLLTGSPDGEVVVHLGNHLGVFQADAHKAAILVELGTECLGVHTGEAAGEEGSNVLGFARYRNGSEAPTPLIELVRQPGSKPEAIAAAKAIFEDARFTVVVCTDQAGRIVDRLVRPKYNDALRFLDEGLATAKDMDVTCRLGLGYRDGPIERVERGGLANHYDVTAALFEVYGTPAYAPARRAVVARQRRDRT